MKHKKIIILVVSLIVFMAIVSGIVIPQYNKNKTYQKIYDRINGIEDEIERKQAIDVFLQGGYLTEEQANELRK